MKMRIAIGIVSALTVTCSIVLAKDYSDKNAEQGKVHFNNRNFSKGQKSCNDCHPNGRGLSTAGAKTQFAVMGGVQKSLDEVINYCLVNANKGEAIDTKSQEMKELVNYIKMLGDQGAPGYGK